MIRRITARQDLRDGRGVHLVRLRAGERTEKPDLPQRCFTRAIEVDLHIVAIVGLEIRINYERLVDPFPRIGLGMKGGVAVVIVVAQPLGSALFSIVVYQVTNCGKRNW